MAASDANQDNPTPEAPAFSERIKAGLPAVRTATASIRRRPGRSALILGGLLAVVIGVAALWLMTRGDPGKRRAQMLAQAFAKLDAGDTVEARRIATELRYGGQLPFEELGGPVFILGAAMARDAEAHWRPEEKGKMFLIAARYLEEARDRGFPLGREAEGLYLLGECLFLSGRYAESLPILHAALEANPSRRTTLRRLISLAYLRDSNPQLSNALDFNQKYLADPALSPDERCAGLLERSQILFQLGNASAAAESLAAIPNDAEIRSEAILMEARLLIREGDELSHASGAAGGRESRAEAAKKYAAAIDKLRLAQGRDVSGSQATRKAAYLLGVCYRNMGDLRAAEEQFARTQQDYPNTPERLAAALQEAEIQRALRKNESAIASYQRALLDAGAPEVYSNAWVSLDDFHARLLTAYRDFIDTKRFQQAVELSQSLAPIFPKAQAVQLQAEAHQKWGEHLQAQAEGVTQAEAAPVLAQARRQFRRAAARYERLARLWITRREHPDALWRSGENYLLGRNYSRAVRMLKQYLENEARGLRPRALAMMGESLLALGDVEQALPPLLECIQLHSKDPDSYRARLMASQAYIEQGDMEKAKSLLRDNLYSEELTPQSVEWRDSLFKLGRVLFLEGVKLASESRLAGVDGLIAAPTDAALEKLETSCTAFLQASNTLSEAVARYPDAPQAIEARYLIAQSHRQAAEWPRRKLASTTIETQRVKLTEDMRRQLEAALAVYDSLLELLNQRQDASELSVLERAVMRNCYFSRGDIEFFLERYESAITAYSSATNRYHDQPESLEAFLQISRCYRQLGRQTEARGTLEQAKVVLNRMPADADFSRTTRCKRDEWVKLLDWLSIL